MPSLQRPLLIERYVAHDRANSIKGGGLSFVGTSCLLATKYSLNREAISCLNDLQKKQGLMLSIEYTTPNPVWIEVEQAIPSPCGHISALLFFPPKRMYQVWQQSTYVRTYRTNNTSGWETGRWTLVLFNNDGHAQLEVAYSYNEWAYVTAHQCPTDQCEIRTVGKKKNKYRQFHPCSTCQNAFRYWTKWFGAVYNHIHLRPLEQLHFETVHLEQSPLQDKQFRHDTNKIIIVSSIAEFNAQKSKKPIQNGPQQNDSNISQTFQTHITDHKYSLIIERYIANQRATTIKGHQSTSLQLHAQQRSIALERAHKYLWMNSAWLMVEVLRQNKDDEPFHMPTQPIYIELEQLHQLHGQQLAAFSFLPRKEQQWQLSTIDTDGHINFSLFYEWAHSPLQGIWTLAQGYQCAEHQCQLEEIEGIRAYKLCESCQEQITHYISWITIALRMVNGDFQEQIELQEPETIQEIVSRTVNAGNGQTKNITVLHRYKVIRYLDACTHKEKVVQTKRGSWMTGRPYAESEYEVNPHAIIYVQIYPREHDRTYRHERYTNMRGKTQHIEPKPRIQPMTIATFQQLKKIERIIYVVASKFE